MRAGYDQRPTGFPQSIVLCGVRDIRDYRIHASSEKAPVTGGSAFNVRARSLRLGDFTHAEVRALLARHTEETGQAFTPEAFNLVWTKTRGQPWLVNALCGRACFDVEAGRDRSRAIAEDAILDAQEHLVVSRQVHLDQLADKLQEDRVRRVVEPLLSGGDERAFTARDLEYGLGRGRTDLLIIWPRGGGPPGPADRFVIECKVLHKSPERALREGLEQTARYMDRCGSGAGHLVIFDRSEGKRWEDKLFRREESFRGRVMTVWGM